MNPKSMNRMSRSKKVLGENFERAERAEEALLFFMHENGNDDLEEAFHDLLCNLQHWADLYQKSFPEALREARRVYRIERKEDNYSRESIWESLHDA